MSNSGRTTDVEFWKAMYSKPTSRWDDNSWDNSGYGTPYYDTDRNSPKTRKKHEFSPILLIYTTCFNCKHCGIKKEDAKFTYCEDENKPNINPHIDGWYDSGGW